MRFSIGGLLMLGAIGIYVFASGSNSPKSNRTSQEVNDAPSNAPTHPLSDVERVRAAVRPILPAPAWEITPGLPGFYGYSEFIYPDLAAPSSLEYHISGPARNEVREVLFEGFISSPERIKSVRKIMTSAAEQWGGSLGIVLPKGLIDAIEAGRHFDATSDGLHFSLDVERGGEIRQPTGGSYRATLMHLRVSVA